jgi:hypothetical protein
MKSLIKGYWRERRLGYTALGDQHAKKGKNKKCIHPNLSFCDGHGIFLGFISTGRFLRDTHSFTSKTRDTDGAVYKGHGAGTKRSEVEIPVGVSALLTCFKNYI